MTPEFTHCALHVRDLDESIAFYESYCGLRIVKEHGKGKERTVWMAQAGEGDGFVLVLLGGGPERAAEQRRYDALRLRRRIPRRCREVAERGRREGRLFWEPQEFPPPTGYLCAVRDPSGYIIEFSYGQPLGRNA